MSDATFKPYLMLCQQRVAEALQRALPPAQEPAGRLKQAMHYSVMNGGKRVRAALVYATAEALQHSIEDHNLDSAACAVEMIHAYSLIHDDLPAMDDDDLRRGQPTCHIAFDEATAILAGDGLQALAFQQLTKTDLPASTQVQLVQTLSQASGVAGMVGGQALDLAAENQSLTLEELQQVHTLKTGALIKSSVHMGAIVAGASTEQLQNLLTYAEAIGLAFQVQDDILDIESDTETLGKTQGADLALHKATYPALLGMAGAKHKLAELHQQAHNALAEFGEAAQPLRALADFIVARVH